MSGNTHEHAVPDSDPVAVAEGSARHANHSLDAETERAARAFRLRVRGQYSVIDAIVFGSRARRTHTAESDADIAVVLKEPAGDRSAIARNMAGMAFDVLLETGILVEALPLSVSDLDSPESFSNPALIRTILREGLRL